MVLSGSSNYIGMKRMASARKTSRSNAISIDRTPVKRAESYVLCVDSGSYEVSLYPNKIYRALRDRDAEEMNMIRVIDESGEDYLFPSEFFIPVKLSPGIRKHIS